MRIEVGDLVRFISYGQFGVNTGALGIVRSINYGVYYVEWLDQDVTLPYHSANNTDCIVGAARDEIELAQ